jgi:hypothetical protein
MKKPSPIPTSAAADEPAQATAKRPYAAPTLARLGSVRDLTLGQSGGRFADGGAKSRKTPG